MRQRKGKEAGREGGCSSTGEMCVCVWVDGGDVRGGLKITCACISPFQRGVFDFFNDRFLSLGMSKSASKADGLMTNDHKVFPQ